VAFDRSGIGARQQHQHVARAANVHHVLTPLISHPPSVCTADVVMPATSEPSRVR